MNRDKIITALEVAVQEEKELLERLKNHKQYIESLKQKLNTPETQINPAQATIHLPEQNGYDRKWAWSKKVAYFIKKENRFLHSHEIQDMLADYEVGMDKKILQKRVSSALARLKRDTNLIPFRAGKTNHDVFWGSDNWLDENKKPKKEFMFKKEYLVKNRTQGSLVF